MEHKRRDWWRLQVQLSLYSPWFDATAAFVSRWKQGYSNGRKFRPSTENSPARPQIPSSATAVPRSEPSRFVRDDNFTAKCTTAPGGTPYTSFRKLPSSRSRSTAVFGALPSLPPFPPARLLSSLLLFFSSFFFDSQCMHARVRVSSTMFTRRHVSKVNGPVISPFISSALSSPISFTSAPI